MREIIRYDRLLFVLMVIGAISFIVGIIVGDYPPYHDILIALGITSVGAAVIAAYMMTTTLQVAKNLYERFDKQNLTLEHLDEHSGKQTEILTAMNNSLQEMVSAQKENHTDMMRVFEKIERTLGTHTLALQKITG